LQLDLPGRCSAALAAAIGQGKRCAIRFQNPDAIRLMPARQTQLPNAQERPLQPVHEGHVG